MQSKYPRQKLCQLWVQWQSKWDNTDYWATWIYLSYLGAHSSWDPSWCMSQWFWIWGTKSINARIMLFWIRRISWSLRTAYVPDDYHSYSFRLIGSHFSQRTSRNEVQCVRNNNSRILIPEQEFAARHETSQIFRNHLSGLTDKASFSSFQTW